MATIDVSSKGARGDGVSLDTAAIQAAIDEVHAGGGGLVVFPGGKRYLSGAIQLLSNVHLTLEPGARLVASTDEAHYRTSRSSCLIEAEGAGNVGIHGFGTIDGQSKEYIEEDLGTIYKPKKWRTGLISFVKCRNVTFRDITLTESAWWTVHLIGCENVLIHGIRIDNDLKMPNCDGIDPDHCRNVRISDCNIRCADDCIVFKNTAPYLALGPSENMTVTNCTLMCTATAVKIGTDSVSDFRNITVSGCTIENSSRGLGIQLRDQGNVENIIFTGCTVETRLFDRWYWGRSEPVHISARHRYPIKLLDDAKEWNPKNELGTVRNIIVSDLICTGENGIFIYGETPEHVQDISLRGINLTIRKWTKWAGGTYDLRPCSATNDPSGKDGTISTGEGNPDVFEHPWSGVSLQNASDIDLQNISVKWQGELPDYYHHALHAKNIQGLRYQDFHGQSPHPKFHPAINLDENCSLEFKDK